MTGLVNISCLYCLGWQPWCPRSTSGCRWGGGRAKKFGHWCEWNIAAGEKLPLSCLGYTKAAGMELWRVWGAKRTQSKLCWLSISCLANANLPLLWGARQGVWDLQQACKIRRWEAGGLGEGVEGAIRCFISQFYFSLQTCSLLCIYCSSTVFSALDGFPW